jgi:hypothetical protein
LYLQMHFPAGDSLYKMISPIGPRQDHLIYE